MTTTTTPRRGRRRWVRRVPRPPPDGGTARATPSRRRAGVVPRHIPIIDFVVGEDEDATIVIEFVDPRVGHGDGEICFIFVVHHIRDHFPSRIIDIRVHPPRPDGDGGEAVIAAQCRPGDNVVHHHRRRTTNPPTSSSLGCGEAGEQRRGGGMVDGVVMERLCEGRRLRTIGGGGGGRRVERRW